MIDQSVDGLTEHIRELLYSTDDSLRDIAKELGLTGRSLSNWLNNSTNPRAYAIVQLCKHFNVSADWLLGLSNEEDRKDRPMTDAQQSISDTETESTRNHLLERIADLEDMIDVLTTKCNYFERVIERARREGRIS